MMQNGEEIYFSLLEEKDESNLIDAIRAIMEENDAHNKDSFNLVQWRWQNKYLPGGKAFIYVGKNKEEQILAYYHVPIYLGKSPAGSHIMYAMIQDVAVSNQLRGRGIFRQIADYANKDLDQKGIQLIYTFPNHKSIHTFVKYDGFTKINTLPAFILPMTGSLILKSRLNIPLLSSAAGFVAEKMLNIARKDYKNNYEVKKHSTFTADIEKLYANFSDSFDFGLVKTAEYLNWRFIQKQEHIILSIENIENGKLLAAAVFKKDFILNMSCVLLMDFGFEKGYEDALLQLIQEAKKQQTKFFGEKLALMFTSCNSTISHQFSKAGFFKIPEKRNPRPLNLLMRTSLSHESATKADRWNITLSDWDVF